MKNRYPRDVLPLPCPPASPVPSSALGGPRTPPPLLGSAIALSFLTLEFALGVAFEPARLGRLVPAANAATTSATSGASTSTSQAARRASLVHSDAARSDAEATASDPPAPRPATRRVASSPKSPPAPAGPNIFEDALRE